MAIVIGPTPPGTGVIKEAFSKAASNGTIFTLKKSLAKTVETHTRD